MFIEFEEKFYNQLKRHEGFRSTVYTCPAGARTIGYGHNLDANPIAGITPATRMKEETAYEILFEDCHRFAEKLDGKIHWWRNLCLPRQAVLLNMAFNLGVAGLMTFRNTLKLIESGDFTGAKTHMLSSKWAGQVKGRAVELARQMETGEWQRGVKL